MSAVTSASAESRLPERIEIVDCPEQITALLPVVDEMVGGGLILVQDVHVVHYRHDHGDASAPA